MRGPSVPFVPTPRLPDEIWEVCLRLKEVLDADMRQFAPVAPF
jgi:hypothetical protein